MATTELRPQEVLLEQPPTRKSVWSGVAWALLGLGAFAFHDVEVVNAASGKPELVLRGKAAALAGERGVAGWMLSLTHTDRTAHAVAVAL